MSKFRVALSSDFLLPDGTPAYPDFDLSPLRDNPAIELDYVSGTGTIPAAELADFDALILLSAKIGAESFAAGTRLAAVARFGVGYDNVDIAACTANACAAVITPDGVRRPVAVSIMTLMLALTGKLLVKDRLTRQGPEGWAQKSAHMGVGLVGKTLGSLGIGNIGAELFRLATPFDMKFIAHDPYADAAVAESLGVRLVGMEELFRNSDVLCVNCPLSEATRHVVDAGRLALMKPTAYLINTARGPIIDQVALTSALRDGRIAGAGLDVFEVEPAPADETLLTLDNVIVTPHALCWTDECFAGNGAADVKAVLDVMAGKAPVGLVDRAIADNQAWQAKLEGYRSKFGG